MFSDIALIIIDLTFLLHQFLDYSVALADSKVFNFLDFDLEAPVDKFQ